MSTACVSNRTAHLVPSRGLPGPPSALDAHRTALPYVGAAVALVLAVMLVDLIRHPRGTRSHRHAAGAPTGAVAKGHRQAPTADGEEPAAGGKGPGADGQALGEGGTTALSAPSHEPMRQLWAWTARRRLSMAVQAAAALALIAVALAPPVVALAERNVRVHHLEHAALLGGGGVLGLVLGLALRPPGHRPPWHRHPMWRQIAVDVVLLGPLVVMAAMIPSTSAWIDTHPLAHALEHLALIGLGGLIGLSARLFSTALGWLMVALVAAMAAAFGAMALAHPLGVIVAGVGAIVPCV